MKLFLISLLCILSYSYLPVIILHGMMATGWEMYKLQQTIIESHPSTNVFLLNFFGTFKSAHTLFDQIPTVIAMIKKIKNDNNFTEFHLIGHSQGGHIGRALLELMDDHQVNTYISLAGVQYGSFLKDVPKGMKIFIPRKVQEIPWQERYKIIYTHESQYDEKWGSIANLYHDSYHVDEYLENNEYLPWINNEGKYNNKKMKENFLKTKKMVYFVSPEDGDLSPWQTAHFGFFKNNSDVEVVEMFDQEIYKKDSFGLKTMYTSGRLELKTVRNVTHFDWMVDKKLFKEQVVDYLI